MSHESSEEISSVQLSPRSDDNEQGSEEKASGGIPTARIQYERYGPMIIFIWAYSWLIPIIGVYYYFKFLIIPNLDGLTSWYLLSQDPKFVMLAVFTPLILLIVYLIRLFLVILFSRWLITFCFWRSPQKELVAAKGIGREEAKAINYYHLRGVILRILKWEVSKSLFPWLVPWAFTFVGANKIGKGTVLEDQFYTQEFLETGENVYIGQGSIVSSHLVEGKYGAITLKKVKFDDGVVIGPFSAIPPGSEMEPRTEFLPMSGIIKFRKVRGFSKYFGLPVGRLSYKRYMKMLEIPDKHVELIKKNKILKKEFKLTQSNKKGEN